MRSKTGKVSRKRIIRNAKCIALPGKNAILAFRLPGERTEYLAAVHGLDWALVALEMDRQLRNWLKYGHEFKTADAALEAARAHLREEIADRGMNLEMIE